MRNAAVVLVLLAWCKTVTPACVFPTLSPTGSPSESPSASPSKSPSMSPTGPTSSPSVSPTFSVTVVGVPGLRPAVQGRRTRVLEGSPTTSPTMSPSTTSPTVCPTATRDIPGPGQSPATLHDGSYIKANNITVNIVGVDTINSVIVIGRHLVLAIAGLPLIDISFLSVATFGSTDGLPAGSQNIVFKIEMDAAAIAGEPSGYLTGFRITMAIQFNANLGQLTMVTITVNGKTYTVNGNTGEVTVTARRAGVLAEGTVNMIICAQANACDGSSTGDDDDFPGWAIAISVILPLIFIGILVAIVFMCLKGSGDHHKGQEEPLPADKHATHSPAGAAVAERPEKAEAPYGV